MNSLHQLLKVRLKKAGYSNTKTRRLVFDTLANQEPQTMHDITHKLATTVDRASTYRTIDLFEKLGIVQKLHIGWKYKIELTDAFHDHHHHMSCLKCGSLTSLDGDSHIEKDIEELAKQHGFTITLHQLEISGYCSNCSS